VIDTAFVSPHAVRQFMERISPLPYDEARDAILNGLESNAMLPKPSHNHDSLYIRVRGQYNFRAVVKKMAGRSLPTVITILKSGK